MGTELGAVYHRLWNELVWLNLKWDEYVELFGTKPSRVDLLNQSAAQFFRIVEDSMWEDVLLHISRLTDSPKSAGKRNLTIRQIPGLVDKEIKEEITQLVEGARDKAEFCRDWRNRHIAHKDLSLALETGAEPLKQASRANVKVAIGAIGDVLNRLSKHYLDAETSFTMVPTGKGAEQLLHVLDDGLRLGREREESRLAGKYDVEDYKTRDL